MTNPVPPLDGIAVLDFTHALAGPYCTMLMAAYGAEVIKVESPEHGDIGRSCGPPFQGSDAAYFVGLNSGKKKLGDRPQEPRRPRQLPQTRREGRALDRGDPLSPRR